MKCVICVRSGEEDFCRWHKESYDKLKESYKQWKEAMGIIWREYLEEVGRNPNTGDWAKEVASYLLKKEESQEIH